MKNKFTTGNNDSKTLCDFIDDVFMYIMSIKGKRIGYV
jgi:hypothetical protein